VLSFEGEGATARATVKWDDRKGPELLSAFDTKALKKLKVRADDRITRSIKREAGGIVAVFDVEGASSTAAAEPAAELVAPLAAPKASRGGGKADAGPVFYLIDYTGGESKNMARVVTPTNTEDRGNMYVLEDPQPLRDAKIGPGKKFHRKGNAIVQVSDNAKLVLGQQLAVEFIKKAALLKAARARLEVESAAKEKVAAGHAKRRSAREKSESARALEEAERVERGERKNLKRNAVRHGSRAAALLVVARDTKRVLIMLRSEIVLEPHTWGMPGGKCERSDKSMRDCAVREFREETDYGGRLLATVEPVSVYREPGFECHNFVGFVDHEFEPELDDESDDYGWFSIDELPQPEHFGVRELFRVAGKQIHAMIARA
jgi:8-oxo-dGTP pyrophosphatase MutT (NUDIX family)